MEIPWQTGLGPQLRPCDLDEAEIAARAETILDLPRRYYRTLGKRGAGHPQDTPLSPRAYERGGEACPRCLAPIEKSMVASRPSTPVCTASAEPRGTAGLPYAVAGSPPDATLPKDLP